MDHSEALRLQASERYVLGELPRELSEEYEEHYFECEECANDVKTAIAFAGGARVFFQKEGRAQVSEGRHSKGWFGWLRPVISAPAIIALLVAVGYQSFVTVPRARKQAASNPAQILFNSYTLRGVNTAGEEGRTLSIRSTEAFLLDFDFVPTRIFESYIGELRDADGHTLLQLKIPGGNANREAHLPIPAGMLQPGMYVLAFYGDPGARGKIGPRNDAGQLVFTVEFRP